ncbi:MAG: DUF2782 domain-containing protein, partial [Gammaproteobacteria bacterium]|nr:DUF2782 domain-containing protein [Gammaproteobacteria bacterium]
MKKLSLTLVIGFFIGLSLNAANANDTDEDQTSGPDVRILADKHQTIEEYRSHGRLYMIKIIPKKG